MAKFRLLATGALGAAALLGGAAQAQYEPPREHAQYEGTNLLDALTGGKVYLEFRPRYEHVNDDANDVKEANALTLRSVLGYETGRFYGFGAFWKILDVRHLAGKAFNEPVTNSNPEYATVGDPSTTQTQEAYLSYKVPAGLYPGGPAYLDYLTGLNLKYGRQVITLQNHRWIGNVVWRQTWLTYDGFSASYDLPYGGHLYYAHLYNANTPASQNARTRRGFGSNSGDIGFNADIINLEFALERWVGAPTTLTGYAYLFDYDKNEQVSAIASSPGLAGQDSSRASNKTFGVRVDGKFPFTPNEDDLSLVYLGEYAHQSNYANGSGVIDAHYIYGRLGFEWYGINLTGNYEVLGSNDGDYAVQTPFATAFAMNGWADRIPGNRAPGVGLVDAWIEANAATPATWGPALSGIKLSARYHDFSSDEGDIKYGTEFDVRLTKQVNEHLELLVQYAAYWGDSEAAGVPSLSSFNLDQDTQKAWVMTTVTF